MKIISHNNTLRAILIVALQVVTLHAADVQLTACGDFYPEHRLIVINGSSSMGKTTIADALKAILDASSELVIKRSSIDEFYQTHLWGSAIQKLDRKMVERVTSWQELFSAVESLPGKRTAGEAQALKFRERIAFFFTIIRPMLPKEVLATVDAKNDRQAFYDDISSSLSTADIVIIDHDILLNGVEAWRDFLGSLSNVAVSYVTLSCDYEAYCARIEKRNVSKNISDHRRPPLPKDQWMRHGHLRKESVDKLLYGANHLRIDSSDKTADMVLKEIPMQWLGYSSPPNP